LRFENKSLIFILELTEKHWKTYMERTGKLVETAESSNRQLELGMVR